MSDAASPAPEAGNLKPEAVAPARPSLLRSAGVVGSMTLLSRITGMAQSIFLAHYLGADAAADAFFVAFRLPNLLRRFTAEGTMTAAFLPTLAEVEAREGEAAMKEAAARFLGTLTALLMGLTLVAILGMGLIAGLLTVGRLTPAGSGFGASFAMLGKVLSGQVAPPPELAMTVRLGRIMFPYLVLVSLTAGFGGLLNLRHKFALASAVSIFWNLTFIAFGWSAIAFGRHLGWTSPEAIATCCALAVLAGGVVQLIALWPAVRRMGFGLRFGTHFRDPNVKRALRRMGPGLISAGIYPINALISTMLASDLPAGAQTVLFNSGMMGEMILGIFAMSLATASLPLMAQQAEAGDLPGLRHSLAQSLRASALMCVPACVGMAVLARPIIALLFHTGKYGSAAVDWTAVTVMYQCAGLLFVAANRVGNQALYALKDYRGPVAVAFASLGANIVLSLVLLKPLGTGGLALANGISAVGGLALLTWRLNLRLKLLPYGPVLKGWAQSLLGAALLGLVAWLGMRATGLGPSLRRGALSLRLFPLMFVCGVVYWAFMALLRHDQAIQLWRALRRRLPV
jgi:putative peptidoglycan lipid II flippase